MEKARKEKLEITDKRRLGVLAQKKENQINSRWLLTIFPLIYRLDFTEWCFYSFFVFFFYLWIPDIMAGWAFKHGQQLSGHRTDSVLFGFSGVLQ